MLVPSCSCRHELHGHTVHAPSLAGRRRAVVEYMTQMPAAAPAVDFGAGAEQPGIGAGANRIVDRRGKARPPSANPPIAAAALASSVRLVMRIIRNPGRAGTVYFDLTRIEVTSSD